MEAELERQLVPSGVSGRVKKAIKTTAAKRPQIVSVDSIAALCLKSVSQRQLDTPQSGSLYPTPFTLTPRR